MVKELNIVGIGSDGVSLEDIADSYIMSNDSVLDKDYPCYSEKYLAARDRRRENSLEDALIDADIHIQDIALDEFIIEAARVDINKAARKKGLNDRELEMIEMRSKQCSFKQIAYAFDIRKQNNELDPVKTAKIVYRNIAIISKLNEFGMWEEIINMYKCERSWWYSAFREQIELARQNGFLS